MMQADDFQAAMLVHLGDAAGERFCEALLGEALRQALGEYSRAAPRLLSGTLTLTSGGAWQSLAVFSGLQEAVEVIFPYDPAAALQRAYAQPMLWLGGRPAPQPGQVLHVLYTGAHTIAGLDGAETTTLPPEHQACISSGAAALAANGRALRLVEAHGSRTDEAGKWLACAALLMQRFHTFLDGVRHAGRVRPPVWQQNAAWRLDGWDV